MSSKSIEKVLVTGANGHIGQHVVRAVIASGRQAVAFVRETSDTRSLEGVQAERRVGDVLDATSLERAAEGCDAIIHCAANFRIWGDEEAIVKPSVVGTENVFAAAAKAGASRVVCTSSQAVIGLSESPEELRSERHWREETHVAYYKAKLAGERTSLACAAKHGIDVVNILPTLVLGDGDYRITDSTKMILELLNGGPTFDGGGNLVTARTVGKAHVAALDRGRAGERYLVGGENISVVDLGKLVAEITGKAPGHFKLPRWGFLALAGLMEMAAGITGQAPPLTRDAVRDVVGRWGYVDCSKAREELGVEALSPRAIVHETAAWLLDRGKLKPATASAVRAMRTPVAA